MSKGNQFAWENAIKSIKRIRNTDTDKTQQNVNLSSMSRFPLEITKDFYQCIGEYQRYHIPKF